jgi:hypothetical protein
MAYLDLPIRLPSPLVSVFTSITLVFWLSVFAYLPGHLAHLSRRFAYYVFEDENADLGLIFRDWMFRQVKRGWDGLRLVGGSGGGREGVGKIQEL